MLHSDSIPNPKDNEPGTVLALIQWLVLGLVVGLVVCVPLFYLGHLYANYEKIQTELTRASAVVVHPTVKDGEVSEIGYIYDMRRDTYIREGHMNLVWFIAVPATKDRYSCSYAEGFPDFKVGDGVKIIHPKSGEDADYGYIIGLHDQERGKTTAVWSIDMGLLEDLQ